MALPNMNQVLRGDGLRVLWMPGLTSGAQHAHRFEFFGVPNSSTFRLWINGTLTSSITYSTTISTTQTNIKNALEAADGLGGTWTVVGTAFTGGVAYVATYSVSNVFFNIRVDIKPASGTLVASISTAGTQEFKMHGAMSSFQFSESIETVDATPVMQIEEDTLVKKSVMTFAYDMYDTDDSWQYALYPGLTGLMTVQEEYGVKNSKYFSFYALLEGVEKNTDGVIEYNITGRRKGPYVKPLGSRY